ncbi:Mdm33 family-domain-containing protein [Cladochytrium replicatum]|nr:Mdm33 family-domain-containing protein [Cladochytrium replicatum]
MLSGRTLRLVKRSLKVGVARLGPQCASASTSASGPEEPISSQEQPLSTSVKLQRALDDATQTLNVLTGYSSVEKLKQRVLERDQQLKEKRLNLQASKDAYERTVEDRSRCQSEINSLLQRKSSWVPDDANRFGDLARRELDLEQRERRAKTEYDNATDGFELAHVEYLSEIRERYIEEQLFSDKIRKASTWWTWGLIGIQITVFIVFNAFLEPRRRRRFENELVEILHEQQVAQAGDQKAAVEKLSQRIEGRDTSGELGAHSVNESGEGDEVMDVTTGNRIRKDIEETARSPKFWIGVGSGVALSGMVLLLRLKQ